MSWLWRVILMAMIVMMLDQGSKWWIVEHMNMPMRPPIAMTEFFNLVMVWNHGVSFGLLSGANAKWLLIAVGVGMSVMLALWARTTTQRAMHLAYGAVIGGALGNVIDRLHYGAVADFLDVHVMGYHWPAFNVADSAILLGVAVIMWLEWQKPRRDCNDSEDEHE